MGKRSSATSLDYSSAISRIQHSEASRTAALPHGYAASRPLLCGMVNRELAASMNVCSYPRILLFTIALPLLQLRSSGAIPTSNLITGLDMPFPQVDIVRFGNLRIGSLLVLRSTGFSRPFRPVLFPFFASLPSLVLRVRCRRVYHSSLPKTSPSVSRMHDADADAAAHHTGSLLPKRFTLV